MSVKGFKSSFLSNLIKPQKLLRQFGISAFVMIIGGMAATGAWLTNQIHDGIMQHTTLSTAVFMERYIQPLILELRSGDHLSKLAIANLNDMGKHGLIKQHVVAMKVWRPDGTVVFSTDNALIGQKFELEDALLSAVNGEYGTEYGNLTAAENEFERTFNKKLIEIYVPMVEDTTGRVFAVSEFYVDADDLPVDLNKRYFESWFVVAAVTLAMLFPLYLIVRRGDKTITAQEAAIENRMAELSNLLAENRELNAHVEQANRMSADVNERFLNRLGADLHDGPLQKLAVAVLWLDSLTAKKVGAVRQSKRVGENIQLIRSTINEVLKEVRHIATGLVLPELAKRSLTETLQLVVDAHQMRTRTSVELVCQNVPELFSATLNNTIYRFVQEGLSNAFRHAQGRGQKVKTAIDNDILTVEVEDSGEGFTIGDVPSLPLHLGLSGIQHRITAIGGTFEIETSHGNGTRLRAKIPLASFPDLVEPSTPAGATS